MARLSIGVDVSGTQAVNKLKTSIGELSTAVAAFQGKSVVGRLAQSDELHKLNKAYKDVGDAAQEAYRQQRSLMTAPSSKFRDMQMGGVAAYHGLVNAQGQYISGLGQQRVLMDEVGRKTIVQTAELNAQTAAMRKLALEGKSFSSPENALDQVNAARILADIESRMASKAAEIARMKQTGAKEVSKALKDEQRAVDELNSSLYRQGELINKREEVKSKSSKAAQVKAEAQAAKDLADIESRMASKAAEIARMKQTGAKEVSKALKDEQRAVDEVTKSLTRQFEVIGKREKATYSRRQEAAAKKMSSGDSLLMGAEAALYDDKGRLKYAINNMKDYEAAMKQASGTSRGFFAEMTRGVPVLGKLGGAWDAATKSSGVFHHTLRGAAGASGALWLSYGRGAAQIGAMAASFVAISSVIKTVKLGSEFDYTARSIQNLAAGAEQGEKGLKNIQQAILSIKGVAAGPSELAAGVLEFARAGKTAEEALAGIAETSRFAYLSEMDLAKAVELVVGQLSAFKGLTVDQALNTMAIVADRSSISLQQMTEAFKNTTSIGTVLGISFDDVAIALGTMGEAGIRGATAGAALNTMMYKLIAPTKAARDTMYELGVSFTMIDEKTGGLKSIEQGMRDLADATKGLTTPQRGELFESMVGLRGLKAIGALVAKAREGSKALEEMRTEVHQLFDTMSDSTAATYLKKRFEDVAKSGQVAIQLLKADLEKLFISSYDNSQTVKAMEKLREVVTDPSVKEGLADMVAGIIGLGSTLLSFATTFGGVAAIGFLGKIIFGSAAAAAASAASMKASVGLVGAAATEAGAAAALAARTVTLAWGGVVTAVAATIYGLHKLAESSVRKAIELAQMQGTDLAVPAGMFLSGDMGVDPGGLISAEQEQFIRNEQRKQEELKKTKEGAASLDGLRADLTDEEMTRYETAAAGLKTIEAQLKAMTATPLQLIKEEQTEELKKFESSMAINRKAFKEGEEGQAAFNAKLEAGRKIINELYGKKISDEMEKQARAASKTARISPEVRANIRIDSSEVKQAAKDAGEWNKEAEKAYNALYRVNEEMQTAGMNQYEKEMYDVGAAFDKNRKAAEEFQKELAKVDGRVAIAEAALAKAKGELVENQKALSSTSGLTDAEEQAKALSLTTTVGNLSKELEELYEWRTKMKDAANWPVANQEQLETAQKEALAVKKLAEAYSILGGYTKELDYSKKKENMDQYNSNVPYIGETAAREIYQREEDYRKLQSVQTTWAESAAIGFREVERQSVYSGQAISDAISSAFAGATDALTEFVMTGKAEIGDLVDSILADLARIAIKESITGPLAGALGGLLKGMVGGLATGSSNPEAYIMGNGQRAFATGGVINSPGLSAYSNSVVTKPTFFPFASGMGLMGEAGPEAILPLKRTANGNLGVESVGNGANVVVNIIESPTKGGQQQQRTDNGVNILDIFVDRVKSAVAADISNGSGVIPNSIQSTYGLNRATGGY